jgi:hypothetical protein
MKLDGMDDGQVSVCVFESKKLLAEDCLALIAFLKSYGEPSGTNGVPVKHEKATVNEAWCRLTALLSTLTNLTRLTKTSSSKQDWILRIGIHTFLVLAFLHGRQCILAATATIEAITKRV